MYSAMHGLPDLLSFNILVNALKYNNTCMYINLADLQNPPPHGNSGYIYSILLCLVMPYIHVLLYSTTLI